jgi:pilus assembly protein Flp/PilA
MLDKILPQEQPMEAEQPGMGALAIARRVASRCFCNLVLSPSINPFSDPARQGVARDGARPVDNLRGREMKTLIKMLKDDSGASAAEYALILAIIGSVIAIAALGLANAIGNAMDDTATCISAPTSANC